MMCAMDEEGPDVIDLAEELARRALALTFYAAQGVPDPVKAALWVAFDWTPDADWPEALVLAVRPATLWYVLEDRDPSVQAHHHQAFRLALTARRLGTHYPFVRAIARRHASAARFTPDQMLRNAA